MDDPDYIVSAATCGKCQYYSRLGGQSTLPCCDYTLCTGKARTLEKIAQCTVKVIGHKVSAPADWHGIGKGGIAVCEY